VRLGVTAMTEKTEVITRIVVEDMWLRWSFSNHDGWDLVEGAGCSVAVMVDDMSDCARSGSVSETATVTAVLLVLLCMAYVINLYMFIC